MKSRVLIAVAAVALGTSGAKSQSLRQTSVYPTSPTQYDTIMIYLAGGMPGCDCRYVDCGGLERSANTFNINLHIVDPGGDCGCETWIWECEYQIGVLDPGEYEVAISGDFSSLVHFTVQQSSVLHVPGQFTTIQTAVDAASEGDTVLVERGTYSEHVEVDKDILLASRYLFSNDPTDIDSTIIDGNLTYASCGGSLLAVVSFEQESGSHAAISGFTIQRGNAGIVCSHGTEVRISDCVIQANVTQCTRWSWVLDDCINCIAGHGIMISGADPTITNCVIRGNGNSGIYASQSRGVVYNTLFHSNSTHADLADPYIGRGGAIHCRDSANLHFLNCSIIGNVSSQIFADSPAGEGPWLSFASAVFSYESLPVLEQCIVAFNHDWYSPFCFGSCDALQGTMVLKSTDIYGNLTGDWVGSIADQAGINGNMSANPLFCDTAAGDYHLSTNSPCAPANNINGVLIGALGVGLCGHVGPWHVSVSGSDETGNGSEQYPFATIQHGVDSALTGDTVLVHPGTYTGPGNRDIDFNGKDITLISQNGPEETTVDCQGSASEPHRGFWYHSGETNAARVEGFTITNGYAPEDDTILTDLGTLVYAHGGGIFCDSASSPTIKECRIINNHALWKGYGSGGDGGGGIYCYKSSPVLEDNVISGNSSGNGGGVALSQSSAHLIRNLIVDNHSSHEAGGVALLGSTDVLESNTISGNNAVVGGGVWLNSSSPTMARCVIAINAGGSFVCSGSSNDPFLTYCDIYQSGGSSWPACVLDQLEQDGNLSADPMFCDGTNGDYHISGYSPCAAENNYWDGTLIGALGVGCHELVCGDADMDGQLTEADVELLQAYYFFQTPPDTYIPIGAVDMDCSNRISLNDLLILAGYFYGNGPAPCCVPPPPPPPPKRPDEHVLD